jgi:hypothetical protein
MSDKQPRDEWLAEKVAAARASVAAGRTYSHEEASRLMAKHVAELEKRMRSKAA